MSDPLVPFIYLLDYNFVAFGWLDRWMKGWTASIQHELLRDSATTLTANDVQSTILFTVTGDWRPCQSNGEYNINNNSIMNLVSTVLFQSGYLQRVKIK